MFIFCDIWRNSLSRNTGLMCPFVLTFIIGESQTDSIVKDPNNENCPYKGHNLVEIYTDVFWSTVLYQAKAHQRDTAGGELLF